VLGLIGVVATGVVIKNGNVEAGSVNATGNLNLYKNITFAGLTRIEEGTSGVLQFINPNGDMKIVLGNGVTTAGLAVFKAGQSDHFSTIPGASFNYYLFEDSAAGKNKEVRIYGYPTGATAKDYAKLQIVNKNRDLLIATNAAGSNITLSPKGSVVVNGNLSVNGNLFVTGCIKYNGGALGTCV